MRSAGLVVLLASGIASAQPAELTKEFQAGIDAYRLGKYDEARAHLEKARSIDPKLPGPHRFLAAVAQAQERWADCIESAHAALEVKPNSVEAVDTRKLYETCRVKAGRTPMPNDLGDGAAIAVTTNVPGATVKINGLTYGGTPMPPRSITPGSLEVDIDKPGWKSAKTSVKALSGIVTDVILDLDPDDTPQGPTEVHDKPAALKIGYLVVPAESGSLTIDDKAPPPLTNARYELDAGTHVIELSQPGKDPWRRRVRITAGQKTTVAPMFVDTETRAHVENRGLYVVGVGGALLAGGFVAAMLSRDAGNEARDIVRIERSRDFTRPLSETGMVEPVRTRDDLQDARDRQSRFAIISTGLYAAGLVTAGVGAYFLYKGARERRDVAPPFAIAPLQGGAMIAKELAW